METCIYLFDKENSLTYKKREHVILAGIGGKRTLPKGYVSDQANELFSKHELMCLRYSPLLIERAHYGPGKRGSMDVNKIDVPDVLSLEPMMEKPNQNYVCPLGFLFQDQAYILPQIVIVLKDDSKKFNIFYLMSTYQTSGNIDESEFQLRLGEFLVSKSRNYKKIDVPYETNSHFICIGCYKKSWYICSTQPDFIIDDWASKILEKTILSEYSKDYQFGTTSALPVFRYRREIDLEYFVPTFIHGKNCFNALALFKGSEFVRQKIFDKFRQCVLTNSSWEMVITPSNNIRPSVARWITRNVCNNEHAVIIYTEDKNIMAFSMLYGKAWGLFILGIGYLGSAFSKAIICDYKNGNEIVYDSEIIS